jgi:hypothetical protein
MMLSSVAVHITAVAVVLLHIHLAGLDSIVVAMTSSGLQPHDDRASVTRDAFFVGAEEFASLFHP